MIEKILVNYYLLIIIVLLFILSILFYTQFFKRFYDIIFSFIGLILLFPLLIFTAILIGIKMGKPIFFRQERPGLYGKIFILHKFRTMNNKTDKNSRILPDGERLTSFGRFLRKTSIDELPELWDILCGKMSIVGPRPLLKEYLPLYNDFQNKRHLIRPGITGLAQINGRNSISWVEKFNLDIKYVENISLLNDLKIILKTFLQVFKCTGINQQGQATMEFFKGNENNSDIKNNSDSKKIVESEKK